MSYTVPQKYQKMTEAEVTQALADKHDSQIVQELAVLIGIYSKQAGKLLQDGVNPEAVLKPPSCALEKLALRMVMDAAKADAAQKA